MQNLPKQFIPKPLRDLIPTPEEMDRAIIKSQEDIYRRNNERIAQSAEEAKRDRELAREADKYSEARYAIRIERDEKKRYKMEYLLSKGITDFSSIK